MNSEADTATVLAPAPRRALYGMHCWGRRRGYRSRPGFRARGRPCGPTNWLRCHCGIRLKIASSNLVCSSRDKCYAVINSFLRVTEDSQKLKVGSAAMRG
jgi:hypothetical protein